MGDLVDSYSSLRILIVDDDDDARGSIQDILELDNHRVTGLSSIRAVLNDVAMPNELDVVLLDRQLPDGLADEFLPQIRERSPNADIIVVTGYADLDGTISALREGVSDYLIKPINPDVMLASLRRIGKRRRIERELLAERQFANIILDTAEAIVLVLDTNANIVRFNPYLSQLTGYSAHESCGRNWIETFIPRRNRERIGRLFDKCLVDADSKVNVNPIVTKDGLEREIRWSNTALKNDSGEIAGVLSIGLDITDLVEAQRNLLQSQRLATIGETMAGLAHESRNALQRLQNAVELLEDDLQDNPSALHDLAKIERASNDVRDLLEEVRAYAAPIQLDRTTTTIASVWRRAWANLEAKRKNRDIELIEHVSADVCDVLVDKKRLEQVFRNLFENALDACADPVQIRVSCHMEDPQLVVEVSDNGPGIPIQQIDRVFDAFHTTKPTGTGLGLSIVHRIIEAHGGTITIPRVDSGAAFTIAVPLISANPS